jgi:hypothetical protein
MTLEIIDPSAAVNINAGYSVSVDAVNGTVIVTDDSGAITVTDTVSNVSLISESTLVEVSNAAITVEVATSGIQGGQGIQGPKGDPGGPVAYLDDLTDVAITTVQADNLIRYSSTASQWVNTSTLDGGNF